MCNMYDKQWISYKQKQGSFKRKTDRLILFKLVCQSLIKVVLVHKHKMFPRSQRERIKLWNLEIKTELMVHVEKGIDEKEREEAIC